MTAIYSAPPHRDVAPTSYVVQLQVSHCKCGATHTSTTIWAKTWLHSRMAHKTFPNLRPIRDPSEVVWNLPIEREQRPAIRIPFCQICLASTSLAHLPKPAAPSAEQVARRLADMGIVQHEVKVTRFTDRHGREHTETVTEKAARPKPKFTVDDL